MPNPYREIFRAPGSVGFSAAGFIARMPFSMVTIGIVTMLSQARGEYWLAGGVAATFALANALIAPQISRLVDRHGQSRVLVPATLGTLLALAGLMLAVSWFVRRRSERLECPIEPGLKAACVAGRRFSTVIFYGSLAIYLIGAFFAYAAPHLID